MATHLHTDSDESEAADGVIELDRYIRATRRRWWVIVGSAVLGAGLAFWYASQAPLMYEGVTTLLVVPPTQASGAQINPATFRAIVENATLASEVIAELKLQDRLNQNLMTPQDFVERALSVEEVRSTNIVKVKVTLTDPGLAAAASRRLAEKAIVLTQQITQQEGTSIQAQLKDHLDGAEQRLRSAEKELLAYKQSAQVELVKGDSDVQLKQRGDLLQLLVDIESERARLSAAKEEIKRQQPLLSTARLPSVEEALRRGPPSETQPPPGEVDAQRIDLTNPFVNPVYQTLDFQIATTTTRIAALEKERDQLMNVKKLGGKDLEQLSELYRRQIAQARLQANFDLATRVYADLAVRYEQSRTQPLGTIAQLQVIDDALPPDLPVARKRLQYGAFGAIVGMIGIVLIAMILENRRRRHA